MKEGKKLSALGKILAYPKPRLTHEMQLQVERSFPPRRAFLFGLLDKEDKGKEGEKGYAEKIKKGRRRGVFQL